MHPIVSVFRAVGTNGVEVGFPGIPEDDEVRSGVEVENRVVARRPVKRSTVGLGPPGTSTASVGSAIPHDLPPWLARIVPVAFSKAGIQSPSWRVDPESLAASSASGGGLTVASSPLGNVTRKRPSGSGAMVFTMTSGRYRAIHPALAKKWQSPAGPCSRREKAGAPGAKSTRRALRSFATPVR